MARKEDESYESDGGETEDEEVKRNCIMGESGMRDSDFFDSDSEVDEEEDEVDNDEKPKESSEGEPKEDQMMELVKFVSLGSQFLKPKGVVLYRPTPIVASNSMTSHSEKSVENDENSNESNLKSSQSTTQINDSPRAKAENDIQVSASTSSCDSDSDSNDGDVESVESEDTDKSTSLDFPFDGGEELSMDVGVRITNIAPCIEEGSCKSSDDDQQEAQESDYALVGASGASVDDKWQMAKQKRVLSSSALSALNQETDGSADHPKKRRLSQQTFNDVCAIPEITLDVEALDQIIQPLPRQYLVRDEYLLISSSSDDDEDKMLSEELEEKFQNTDVVCSDAKLPIPLLTPPQSPRTVDDSIEGQAMTSIEWPSNLVMDSAIIKGFAHISPVPTNSTSDEQEKTDDSSSILGVGEPSKRSSATRLRTISVATT